MRDGLKTYCKLKVVIKRQEKQATFHWSLPSLHKDTKCHANILNIGVDKTPASIMMNTLRASDWSGLILAGDHKNLSKTLSSAGLQP